jgi:hypothetical protein
MVNRVLPYAFMLAVAGIWLVTRFMGPRAGELHPHRPAQHGGEIHSLADDSYHFETVLLSDGTLKVFTYGRDETAPLPVPADRATGYWRREGEQISHEFELVPEPQAGDPKGTTTRFTANLPEISSNQPAVFSVPAFVLGGKPRRLAWSTLAQHRDASMPEELPLASQREVYLRAGGKYTEDDIIANGSTTAAQRYASFRPRHDRNPRSGDYLCPITGTKANLDCSWVVSGDRYFFCCPPCIDEFVQTAKEADEDLPPSASFVKP